MESQNAAAPSNDDQASNATNPETLDKELRYELGTLVGASGALLCFFVTTFFLSTIPASIIFLPSPLIIYNLIKTIYCLACIIRSNGLEKSLLLKDIIEAILMMGYYV